MQIQIFNVAHGFCAYVIADNGNTMLMDCGHNDQTGFFPADYLAANNCTGIERFFVLNYDEDHLSGLPRLREWSARIPIDILNRNPSISRDQLRAIKAVGGPLGDGMKALLDMLATYTSGVTTFPDFGQLAYAEYFNNYPLFQDTNNLSHVVFLHYPGMSIVFPGDLERPGWQALLRNPNFCNELAKVDIFVASHHGRASGYEPDVFKYCAPTVIVISDEEKMFETQEHSYSQHATGLRWNNADTRRVLTTRNDGMLTITTKPGGFHIQAGG